ncbi:MAG: DUF433 domain-containing protein [Bacteroidota bacterium]|nr:DUF433 domain-containing protein [Bacteroidota bacterium]
MNLLNKYIEINKDLVGGQPVFRGTRVTVKTLFDYLEESSIEEFLEGHPTVSREQAESVLEAAAENFLATLS